MRDLGLNDHIKIRESDDGPYIVVHPPGPGPSGGNSYPVDIVEHDGKWFADFPTIPDVGTVEGRTREEVKERLEQQLRNYLRSRPAPEKE